MKKLYFAVGSQDLYGDECLRQVAEDSRQMAEFLNEKLKDIAEVELVPTIINSESCIKTMRQASCDDDCVGDHLDAYLLPGQDVDQRPSGVEKTASASAYPGK